MARRGRVAAIYEDAVRAARAGPPARPRRLRTAGSTSWCASRAEPPARDTAASELAGLGVGTKPYFLPLPDLEGTPGEHAGPAVPTRLAPEVLALPMSSELNEEQADLVCVALERVFGPSHGEPRPDRPRHRRSWTSGRADRAVPDRQSCLPRSARLGSVDSPRSWSIDAAGSAASRARHPSRPQTVEPTNSPRTSIRRGRRLIAPTRSAVEQVEFRFVPPSAHTPGASPARWPPRRSPGPDSSTVSATGNRPVPPRARPGGPPPGGRWPPPGRRRTAPSPWPPRRPPPRGQVRRVHGRLDHGEAGSSPRARAAAAMAGACSTPTTGWPRPAAVRRRGPTRSRRRSPGRARRGQAGLNPSHASSS